MNTEAVSSAYRAAVIKAADALKTRNFDVSRSAIASAMAMNMDAPEPHNLLGILYEMTGDDLLARQHYRAAYALDPTYKPSSRNLERLGMYSMSHRNGSIDFGVPMDASQADA